MRTLPKDIFRTGLFDPEHLKRVRELQKTWRPAYPTQESMTQFFRELREGIEKDIRENPDSYWAKLNKS